MKTVILALALTLPSLAYAQQPMATTEQRLALQIASLTLQLANAGVTIDKQVAEIKALQGQIDDLKKPKTK